MPELPDVELYVEHLAHRVVGRRLARVRIASSSLLRTVDPPPAAAEGRAVRGVRRLGKRVVVALEGQIFLAIHLMIAGRLRWRPPGAAIPRRGGLAAFDFEPGTLLFGEAGSKRRASLHVLRGEAALAELDAGGLEVIGSSLADFRERLVLGNHTLKRALTDPHLFAGIGGAYGDEILHAARLSPVTLATRLGDVEVERLWRAAQEVLVAWTERLRAETGPDFPEKVTAFRPGMAVHGRYREPCPACGSPVQRIAYAENETNYCPTCQTGGRLLADRALSRLLHRDWPRTLDELEARRRGRA